MNSDLPHLRPLKAGEILDQAFRLYRAHFSLLLAAVSLALMPLLLFELAGMYFSVPTIILQFFELFIKVNVVNGAMIWLASRLYLGQPALIFGAYWKTLGRSISLFVANLSVGAVYVSAFVFFWLVAFAISLLFPSWWGWAREIALLVLIPLIVIYVVLWYVRLGLYLPLIMIEGLGAKDALARSWLLIKRDFLRVLVVLIACSLLSYAVVLLPGFLINGLAIQFDLMYGVGFSLVSVVTQLFGNILSLPLTTSIIVVLYYDLRVRREGYDLQWALGLTDEALDLSDEEDLPEPQLEGENHVPQY